jgi:hypothetical protein
MVVVTEVLLSLLSNLGATGGAAGSVSALPPPGAALVRETVKLASAGLAPLVNAGAVEAVVSVLAASFEELAPEPAAAAETDAASEDAVDSSDSSEEETEDEDEDESDEEEEAAAASDDADSDVQLDDAATAVTDGTLPMPSAAELAAMDRMVSSIVNAKADNAAAAAAAKARRDAALHFQFRASDLLDAWAGRMLGRTQQLLLLMPLLRASRVLGNRVRLSGGSHPCKGIGQRVNALLTKLTAKTGAAPQLLADLDEDSEAGDVALDGAPVEASGSDGEEADADSEGDVLDAEEVGMTGVTLTGAAVAVEECVLLASGAYGGDFVTASGRVAGVFLRSLMEAGALDDDALLAPVAAVFSDALTSYLTHKNSKFTSKLFTPLWGLGGPVAVSVIPALLHGMAAGVNGFRAADSVVMLGALLRGAGDVLSIGTDVPQVAVNTAIVGKRLDTAADAASAAGDATAAVAVPTPTERLSREAVQDIADAMAISLSDLLLRAAQAGRLKVASQINAARLKDLIAFARQLVAPKPAASGTKVCAPQGEAQTALVQALSALVHCASSGKVQNAAQSALSRLGQGPLKLDLSWFEGMPAPTGSGNASSKAVKGTKRERSGVSAVEAKLQAATAFADLAGGEMEGAEGGDASVAAPKSTKKAKKAKKAQA